MPTPKGGGPGWNASAFSRGSGPDRAGRVPRAARARLAGDARSASKAGWGNYSIFLAGDGLLVGYLETDDYQAALDAMAATDVNRRWQEEMSEFFVADGAPDQSFLRLAEIFHLD